MAAPEALAAKNTVSLLTNVKWQKALALRAKKDDPVAAKLSAWIYVTQTEGPADVSAMMSFVRRNETWPGLHHFHDRIEDDIESAKLKPYEITEWFRAYPPRRYRGITAFMNALIKQGYKKEAKKALTVFWQDGRLDKNETAALISRYKNYFQRGSHKQRLDTLIWADRLTEAKYMLAFVHPDTRVWGQARIELARMSSKANATLAKVPDYLKTDEGLRYERARWRRRKKMNDGALDMIDTALAGPVTHPEKWWREKNIIARRYIEDHNYKGAANIIRKHKLEPGNLAYSEAEWLLGWLELRFLNKPHESYARFKNLYTQVNSTISRSRMAYWSARAAEEAQQTDIANKWHDIAAAFPSTYYGQLSYRERYGALTPERLEREQVRPETTAKFKQLELVRAVRLLKETGLEELADSFLSRLLNKSKNKETYILIAKLAHNISRPEYAVRANKQVQKNRIGFLPTVGYPLLSGKTDAATDTALIHAITYRESMFNAQAISSAGARGLMQLMPRTAKAVSRRLRKGYRKSKLTTDPAYNVILGTAYLRSLIDRYEGYYPLAIAAYNAGPGNVSKWIDIFGHPAQKNIDIVDWIELIPIYETRNYVQRVMETHYIYSLRFRQKPRTIKDL